MTAVTRTSTAQPAQAAPGGAGAGSWRPGRAAALGVCALALYSAVVGVAGAQHGEHARVAGGGTTLHGAYQSLTGAVPSPPPPAAPTSDGAPAPAPQPADVAFSARALRGTGGRPGTGMRITGLSADGVGVGLDAAHRAVRWSGSRAIRLTRSAQPTGVPLTDAAGTIAFDVTGPDAVTATAVVNGRTRRLPLTGSATVLAVAGGRVLVRAAGQPALWSPAAGSVTLLPAALDARHLLADGTALGVTSDATVLLTRPGGGTVPLPVPAGWHAAARPDGPTAGTLAGTITADAGSRAGESVAVRWIGLRPQYLPGLGGRRAAAVAVNARGQVAGTAQTPGGDTHAVLWDAAGRVHDLGTLGGPASAATGIAADGTVVGWARTASGVRHAVLWRDGAILDLGAGAAGAGTGAGTGAGRPDVASAAQGISGGRVWGMRDGVPTIWTVRGSGSP